MIRVFFFLWTTTIFVLANAAPQGSNSVVDGNDPTEAEQSFLGSEFSISSLGDSSGDPQDSSAMTTYPPQDAFYVADAIDKKDTANSTNIECHSDTSTNNFWYEDNDQKRSISKRGKACSTDTMTTTKFSPTITYPELWQQEPKDKTTPRLRNPCANLGTKQTLLSCGGPIFPQGNSMNVLNCVLGKILFIRLPLLNQNSMTDEVATTNRSNESYTTTFGVSDDMERRPILLFSPLKRSCKWI